MWSSVKNSKDPEDYRLYLARFPNGTFADLARSRAAALSRPAAAPVVATAPMAAAPVPTAVEAASGDIRTAEASKATEDALGLSIDAWKEIQRRLTGLQFNTRGMDGRVGEGTRRGLASWQSARGYPATGYLNRLQHEALLKEVVARAPVSASPTAARAPESKGKQQRRGDESGDPGAAGEFVGGILKGYLNKGGRLPF
jgi:peptidoglycan hydrolase-like protein with peptidoglycan-binding domain